MKFSAAVNTGDDRPRMQRPLTVGALLCCSCCIFWPLAVSSQESDVYFAAQVTPNGQLLVPTDQLNPSLFGNDVINRSRVLLTTPMRTFIDVEHPLRSQPLKSFLFYVHPLSETTVQSAGSTVLRLQIWHPVPGSPEVYRLAFQRRVNVSLSTTGALYNVSVGDAQWTTIQGDCLGWTTEDTLGVISYDFSESRRICMNEWKSGGDGPSEGNTTVECHSGQNYPAVVSIAAESGELPLTPTAFNCTGQRPFTQPNMSGSDSIPCHPTNYGDPGRKSFVDTNNPMQFRGQVSAFLFYFKTDVAGAIRLQVWRQNTTVLNRFRLVWERRVVTLPTPGGSIYKVEIGDLATVIEPGDFLGWTNENTEGVIGMTQSSMVRCYFSNVRNKGSSDYLNFPVLGQWTDFDTLPYPAHFYVAMKLDPVVEPMNPPRSDRNVVWPPAPGPDDVPSQNGGNTDPIVPPDIPTAESQRTYIDVGHPLPGGILSTIFFYAIRSNDDNIIRFQIWRPSTNGSGSGGNGAVRSFQLVWEQRIVITSDQSGGLFTLNVTGKFSTVPGDYIGWTNEREFGIIAYENRSGVANTTYCRVLPAYFAGPDYPTVSRSYNFTRLGYSAIFTIGVYVYSANQSTSSSSSVSSFSSTTTYPHPNSSLTTTSPTDRTASSLFSSSSVESSSNSSPESITSSRNGSSGGIDGGSDGPSSTPIPTPYSVSSSSSIITTTTNNNNNNNSQSSSSTSLAIIIDPLTAPSSPSSSTSSGTNETWNSVPSNSTTTTMNSLANVSSSSMTTKTTTYEVTKTSSTTVVTESPNMPGPNSEQPTIPSEQRPQITRMWPTYGPRAGATAVTYTGQHLNYSRVNFIEYLTITRDGHELRSSETEIVALTPALNDTEQLRYVTVTIRLVGGFELSAPSQFQYKENPTIIDVFPRQHLTTGGTSVTVNGTHLDSVAQPMITLTVVLSRFNPPPTPPTISVTHVTDTCTPSTDGGFTMGCIMPSLQLPSPDFDDYELANHTIPNPPGVASYWGPRDASRVDIYLGFKLDGFTKYDNLTSVNLPPIGGTGGKEGEPLFQFYSPPPIVKCNASSKNSYSVRDNNELSISGSNMRRGCRIDDYKITVGDARCTNLDLTENQMLYRLPSSKPRRGALDDSFCTRDGYAVIVNVGYKQYDTKLLCGCIKFTTTNYDLIIGLTIGLGVPFLLLLLLLLILCLCWRRRHRKYVVDPYGTAWDSTLRKKYATMESTGTPSTGGTLPSRYGTGTVRKRAALQVGDEDLDDGELSYAPPPPPPAFIAGYGSAERQSHEGYLDYLEAERSSNGDSVGGAAEDNGDDDDARLFRARGNVNHAAQIN